MTFMWTEDNVRSLSEWWLAGVTSRGIATQLGTTRNSIIGKVHRLGLPLRTPDRGGISSPRLGPRIRIRDRTKKAGNPNAARVLNASGVRLWNTRGGSVGPSPVKDRNTLTPTAKSMMDLARDDCRFPIGDLGAAGSGFCGRADDGLSSYCAMHHSITYNPKYPQGAK